MSMNFDNYMSLLSEDIRLEKINSFFVDLIKEKNFSNKQLAKHINIPYRSLMNYLKGTRSIPLCICKQILKCLSADSKEYDYMFNQLFEKTVYFKSKSSKSKEV